MARRLTYSCHKGTSTPPRDGQRVEVTCWCERSDRLGWVRLEMVNRGQTWSCGPDCGPNVQHPRR